MCKVELMSLLYFSAPKVKCTPARQQQESFQNPFRRSMEQAPAACCGAPDIFWIHDQGDSDSRL